MKSLILGLAGALTLAITPHIHAQQWTTPTPEELGMTSIATVPGADAVILNHEEVDDDDLHVQHHYYRIKILNEKGLRYANVDLNYNRANDGSDFHVGEFFGRTIQTDGSVVPFTGKGLQTIVEKDKENALTRSAFSMPAARVGSILEYRYTFRIDDHWFSSPWWNLQGDLFVRNEKFLWKPTDHFDRITWATSLPAGVTVSKKMLPTGRLNMEVSATDVMPFANEQYMPPIRSSRYHVIFYFTEFYNLQEFWQSKVKDWISSSNKFESNGNTVSTAAHDVVQGATTDEQKARKLYAFIMTLENTDYTRSRTSQEEKNSITSAEDVLKRKHGTANQLALTYVALARSAGLKAGAMRVSDRSDLILDVTWQDFRQLSDNIAYVTYDGADHYVDPGSRYMPFGHLEWDHTIVGGVRQDAKDLKDPKTLFVLTPGDTYKFSHTSRVGDLKVEENGHMNGKLTFTYDGSPALRWRHVALRNDTAELKDQIKKEIEHLLPADTDVEVLQIDNVDNGELPLKVQAKVSGRIGNTVGSRVMLPSDIFEFNSSPTFPHERRDLGVYFSYNEMVQDAVRYTLPAGWAVESAPNGQLARLKTTAAYSLNSQQAANTITLRRDFIMGEIYFPHEQYAELRTFYNDLEAKDHSNVVIKRNPTTASAAAPAASN